MSSLFLTAALVGLSLVHGAEPTAEATVTKEAAPVEAAPAAPQAQPGDTMPLPKMDLPAQTVQGDPAPPQGTTAPTTEPTPPPAADAASAAPADSQAAAPADAVTAAAPSEEMTRPTENKNRSGKKVAAFWFITTGK